VALVFWLNGLVSGSDTEKRSFEKDASMMGQTRIKNKVYEIKLIKVDDK
jgi:hypothetical protein